MRKPFNEALRIAGIEGFNIHDLRHTFCSYLAMNGASTLQMMKLMGHKSMNMVARYAHLSPDHEADLVETMNKRFIK